MRSSVTIALCPSEASTRAHVSDAVKTLRKNLTPLSSILPPQMKTHELKIWPQYFFHLVRGSKTAEFRKDDRSFEAGDLIHFREWVNGVYTGEEAYCVILHVDRGEIIPEGYALLSIARAHISRPTGLACEQVSPPTDSE